MGGHYKKGAVLQRRAARRDELEGELERVKEILSQRPEGASLDAFYIPTRYPNGLPGGLPSEAYTREEADRAIEKSSKVVQLMERNL
jgi:HEPN domain-containing protein